MGGRIDLRKGQALIEAGSSSGGGTVIEGFARGTTASETFIFRDTRADMIGGGGRDTFVIEELAGREHVIRDFSDDTIDLRDVLGAGNDEVVLREATWGGETHTRILVDTNYDDRYEQAVLLRGVRDLSLQEMD